MIDPKLTNQCSEDSQCHGDFRKEADGTSSCTEKSRLVRTDLPEKRPFAVKPEKRRRTNLGESRGRAFRAEKPAVARNYRPVTDWQVREGAGSCCVQSGARVAKQRRGGRTLRALLHCAKGLNVLSVQQEATAGVKTEQCRHQYLPQRIF